MAEGRKKKEKRKDKHLWSTKGGYLAPIFVPSSPGGELARRMKKVALEEKEKEINFKIVEMGGTTLKKELQKSNLTATPGCRKVVYYIRCRKERGQGCQCLRNNVSFKVRMQYHIFYCQRDRKHISKIGKTLF